MGADRKEQNIFYAHSKPGCPDTSQWHKLDDHLKSTAELASKFAGAFESADWAWNAGWLHDVGKAAPEFQSYLLRENELDDSEYDGRASGRVNHSSAGAAFAEESFNQPRRPIGRPLAYVVAGHHAGLPDWYEADSGNAALRIRLEEGRQNLERIRSAAKLYARNLRASVKPPSCLKQDGFHLWVRMLYSCLVDADFLDTETYMQPEQAPQRAGFLSLAELKSAFDRHMERKTTDSPKTPVNEIRQEVLAACRAAAAHAPGLFSLSVPTGGGKTLSGMAFALDHAVRHGKDRIVYVIPYTSIIEQTAQILADILGCGNVVEHHSNLDPERETQRSRLAAENWDAPIIVTTNVQFFESLYSAKSSRCRKLHNIVNSVVILDEAQLLPPELLGPCVDAMNQLVRHYGVTLMLATATQPALPGLDKPHEIIRNAVELYGRLKRTDTIWPANPSEPTDWQTLATRLQTHEQVLCVVNSRRSCHDLFRLMPPGTVHLSALMCGEHRSSVIAGIRQRLKNGLPTRVISTQLVEAGVDMDFPVVYRAWAGLDSIAQAGGRCNREGRLNAAGRLGEVHVFVPPKPSRPGLLRKGEDTTRELRALPDFDADHPDAFPCYFRLFYDRVNDTGAGILKDLTPSDPATLDVHFRTVGEQFRLIKDEQRPLFVHYDATADSLIKQLHFGGPTRDRLRRLQRYTVNLPHGLCEQLKRDVVEEWPAIWAWNGRYDKDCGVDIFGDGLSPEGSVI